MKWGGIFGITVIVVLITLYEWPKINTREKKEKAAFIAISVIGWLLAVLLLHFPDMPGPSQLLETIYKPLGKLMES